MTVAIDTISPPISGPRFANSPASVALGAYTEITQIIAPPSAVAGSPVTIKVTVKNLAAYGIFIGVTGSYDTTELYSVPDYAGVDSGATYVFTLSFTMPSKNLRVKIFSHFWTGYWYTDDQSYVDIALVVGWVKLATKTITITPIVVAWQKLASKTITIIPEVAPPVGWVKLATKTITLTPTIAPPIFTCSYCGAIFATKAELDAHIKLEHPEVPPPEEKKFPWVPVLIGGGVALAVIGLTAKERK